MCWGGGEGGHSLIWPRWVCAPEQGVVFRVLTLEQGFHHLASGMYCGNKQSTCACKGFRSLVLNKVIA